MVELEAGSARAPLPVDDRRAHDPLAQAFPQAFRSLRAVDSGGDRLRARYDPGVPALPPQALSARHGSPARRGSSSLHDLPTLPPPPSRPPAPLPALPRP